MMCRHGLVDPTVPFRTLCNGIETRGVAKYHYLADLAMQRLGLWASVSMASNDFLNEKKIYLLIAHFQSFYPLHIAHFRSFYPLTRSRELLLSVLLASLEYLLDPTFLIRPNDSAPFD